jgi:hypothetical protein
MLSGCYAHLIRSALEGADFGLLSAAFEQARWTFEVKNRSQDSSEGVPKKEHMPTVKVCTGCFWRAPIMGELEAKERLGHWHGFTTPQALPTNKQVVCSSLENSTLARWQASC